MYFSDTTHILESFLQQRNIVGVWRLGSELITPHRFMFTQRYRGVLSKYLGTPCRRLQVDAEGGGGAERTGRNTDAWQQLH